MSAKRKRVVVSLEQKLNAIKRLDRGETIKKVASDFGVGEVTVGDWRRKREQIEQWVSQRFQITGNEDIATQRKTMKNSDYEQTSEALFIWFQQMRDKGSPLSGPMLQAKALEFFQRFKEGEEEFTASQGWLDRWKRRYGVRQLTISGELLSADTSKLHSFINKLEKIIRKTKLSPQQIYNCDETGLNFKLLPSKTLAAKQEQSAPGYKKSKERVTVLCCANRSGDHKVKLLLIGKAKKPRAFKNVNMEALPVMYANQKSAWMDSSIFKMWFFEQFVPSVKKFCDENNLPHKALLLMDNAPTHPDETELVSGDIRSLFLPPNVTSLIQPLDQGVIENLKRHYRHKLLKHLLQDLENDQSVVESLKKINLKDVIYWLSESWNDIKESTLQKSWKNISPKNDTIEPSENQDDFDDDDLIPLSRLLNKLPVAEAISDEDVKGWMNDDVNELSDEGIANLVTQNRNSDDEDDDESTERGVDSKISHTEGLAAIEKALLYVEQQDDTLPADIIMLQRLRRTASNKRGSAIKQTTLKDFFQKM